MNLRKLKKLKDSYSKSFLDVISSLKAEAAEVVKPGYDGNLGFSKVVNLDASFLDIVHNMCEPSFKNEVFVIAYSDPEPDEVEYQTPKFSSQWYPSKSVYVGVEASYLDVSDITVSASSAESAILDLIDEGVTRELDDIHEERDWHSTRDKNFNDEEYKKRESTLFSSEKRLKERLYKGGKYSITYYASKEISKIKPREKHTLPLSIRRLLEKHGFELYYESGTDYVVGGYVMDDYAGPYTKEELLEIWKDDGYSSDETQLEDFFEGYPSKQGLYVADRSMSLGEGWSIEEFCKIDDLDKLLEPKGYTTGDIFKEDDSLLVEIIKI